MNKNISEYIYDQNYCCVIYNPNIFIFSVTPPECHFVLAEIGRL